MSRKKERQLRGVKKRLDVENGLKRRSGGKFSKAKIGLVGAVFLAVIGYLSAGDKAVDLFRKWSNVFREATLSLTHSVPFIRERTVSKLIQENFPADVCAAQSGLIDVERDGVSSDLVVTVVDLDVSPDCESWVQPAVAVFKNVGWTWRALELVSVPMSGIQASWHNNYVFLEGGGDFPGFAVYGFESGEMREIHSDYGELPSKEELFAYGTDSKLLLSGRNRDVIVDYDHRLGSYNVEEIAFDMESRSKRNVLTSVPTEDWVETYSFNGAILEIQNEKYEFVKGLGSLDLVYVPNHCDTTGLQRAKTFPGFYRRIDRSIEARICCPIDAGEYGSCSEETAPASDSEALIIELQPRSND